MCTFLSRVLLPDTRPTYAFSREFVIGDIRSNRQNIGHDDGNQICYTYYVPVEEKRSKVFPSRKICNSGRMKCHVVPGLNVALHYVIAVRNGIIPRNGYNESFCTCAFNISLYTCEK